MHFPYPVAVCDVGGTNCRISIQDAPGANLRALPHQLTADHEGLGEAIEAATAEHATKPKSVIACGAGPVDGRRLKLTNAPWVMDGPEIAAMLDLKDGLLLNDFEAQALSLPSLEADWVETIGPALDPGPGPQVILGPGTGLGIAALVDAEGKFTPVSSEACHIGFAPVTAEERKLWPHLEKAHGRITTESVLSGAGLERLHRARLAAAGEDPPSDVKAADITAEALKDHEGPEAATIACYWGLIARFAGDIAITFMATGGVTLAGGILPRIFDLVDAKAFRAAFEDKAPVAALARRIPTRLVTKSDSVLGGMAALAADPDRFLLDYAARRWRG